MRTPFVKRHPTPRSGVGAFFRFPGPGAVCSPSRVLTALPWAGAPLAWRPQTRLAALSPPGWRVQRTMGDILCGLARRLCPRTGLGTGLAEPRRRAREGQARARGSTRPWMRLAPLVQEPERGSQPRRGLGDTRPRRPGAVRDAVKPDRTSARDRLSPSVASSAAGAPALLP
jgi:hypothetical protein